MTGLDLVSASMRLIGVLASGESPSASESKDGLAALNRMLDSWSNEGLLLYGETQESPITLVGGQATYHLGTGGDITTRPQEILRAVIRDGAMDYPVHVLTLDQYAGIPNKSVQSTYPQGLYDDGGYPQRTISLFPVPAGAKQLVLWTNRPLSQIATLTTTLSLPPGFERALVYGGAVELAPEYGKSVSPEVAASANEAKANAKRANKREYLLRADSGMVGRSHFNIFTGEYNR